MVLLHTVGGAAKLFCVSWLNWAALLKPLAAATMEAIARAKVTDGKRRRGRRKAAPASESAERRSMKAVKSASILDPEGCRAAGRTLLTLGKHTTAENKGKGVLEVAVPEERLKRLTKRVHPHRSGIDEDRRSRAIDVGVGRDG